MNWRTVCLLAVYLLVAPVSGTPTWAQAPGDISKLEGVWVAPVKPLLGKPIRLVLRVEKGVGGAFDTTLDTPEQEAFGLEVTGLELQDQIVRFESKVARVKFEGKLNEAGTAIDGSWMQGRAISVTFTKTDPDQVPKAPVVEVPAELEGLWSGAIAVQAGLELRVVLNVTEKAPGRRRAVLDSPDQSLSGLPISALTLKDGNLAFEMKLLKAEFTGKRSEDGIAYEGTWTQLGRKFPLTLKKVMRVEGPKRTQMPTAPFPYDVEEVIYENVEAGVKLAGSLTLPRGAGPFPAVLLISGSGAQDRDETLLGHKPFLVLADDLTRKGIAVLRVDDRGVGGSTGDTANSTSADFAGDVLAGVAFLKGHARINPRKIGLVGHSEGGVVGPIAASKSEDVAFVVMMAGTGVPGLDILRLQGKLIAQAMGATPRALELQSEILDASYRLIKEESDPKLLTQKIKALTAEKLAGLTAEERKAVEGESGGQATAETIEASIVQMSTPWFRYFLDHDPRPVLRKVHCPVLAINGEKDLQVPPTQNLPEIEKALRDGGNTRSVVKELPGLNHLFQVASTGAPSEYAKIEETMTPAVLELIGTWILEQVGP